MFINPVMNKINNSSPCGLGKVKPYSSILTKKQMANSSLSFGRMLSELSGEEIWQISAFGQACVKRINVRLDLIGSKGYFEQKDAYILGKKADVIFSGSENLTLPHFKGYFIRTENEMMLFDLPHNYNDIPRIFPEDNNVFNHKLKYYARLSTEKGKTAMHRFVLKDDGKSIDHVEEYSGKSIEFDAFTHFLTGNKHKHKF